MTDAELKNEFEKELNELVQKIIEEVYTPKILMKMIRQEGGYNAVKTLMANPGSSYGYLKLGEAGRLDLSIETIVIKEKYKSLFSKVEVGICKARLEIR